MKCSWIFSIFLLCCAAVLAAPDLSVLVQSERDFSRLAVEKGVRTAFLEFLAEDSVVFQNGPVNGRKWYEGRPDSPGILYWAPAVAELSAAGDIGYSTGPWEFRKSSMEEKPVAYGTFVSIWKKQPDGRFKVAVDLGCSYPSASVTVDSLEKAVIPRAPAGKTVAHANMDAEKAMLLKEDSDFSALCAEKGAVMAYAARAVPMIRIVREGMEPVSAPDAVRAELQKIEGRLSWKPASAGVAAGGDLGYTYGESNLAGAATVEKGDYLRVWKRQPDGQWKAILDVISKRE